MKRILPGILLAFLMCSTVHANINTDSSESKIKITDSAGKGKLVLTTDFGSSAVADMYDGTIEVDAPLLNRRIQVDDTDRTLYLRNANVITGTSRSRLSAWYRNEATGNDAKDRIILATNDVGDVARWQTFARFEPGTEVRELVVGDGNSRVGTAYIQGAPIFKTPIRLDKSFSAAHIIHWGLTGKLNQSIQLPDLSSLFVTSTTQFILDQDLRLGDGVVFIPQKYNHPYYSPELKITFSNSKLALGGTDLTWQSTLLLENANDIEMNADVKLSGEWLFSGNGMLQGNGNILDLSGRDASNTGTLGFDTAYLGDNPAVTVTLFLRDIKLRLRNGALFTHERTILDLSNVEIELENTVNFTSGNIRISGPTMIYSKNHTFSISHGATMTVDGTVLYYDSGQHYNKKGVFPNDVLDDDKTVMGEALNFQHDGYIQMIAKPEVTLLVTPGNNSGANIGNTDSGAGSLASPYVFTSDKDMWLSGDVQLVFDNSGNIGTQRFYRFNGDNHFVHFARESNCMVLQGGTRVSFVNTVFKDFDPSGVELQTDGGLKAQVFFGQGCVLEFGADVELGTATDSLYTLSIKLDTGATVNNGTPGNENIVKINGQGHGLSLPYAAGQSTPGQIVLLNSDNNAGIRLDLENITIDKLGGWPRRLEAEHSIAQICSVQHTNTVLYRNAQLNLSSHYSYSHGSLIIDGIVHIDGRNNIDAAGPEGAISTTFIFQPARQSVMTFSHNAKLIVGRNVTFSVDPIITDGITIGNAGTVEYDVPYKSIVFDDDSAVMHFDGSTLHVTATGLYFQRGALNIENVVTWFAGDENHGEDTGVQQRIAIDSTAGLETSINIFAGAALNIQGPVHYFNVP